MTGLVAVRRRASGLVKTPAAVFCAVALAYALLAREGLQLVDAGSGIASFWPPNGLIVGLLLVSNRRFRTPIALAVLPGELIADYVQGFPLPAALGWGSTNLVESILAVAIILRVARRTPSGLNQRDFVALAVGASVAPAICGLLGGAVSYLSYGGSYVDAWTTWWVGDAVGLLLVVPLVFSLALKMPARRPRWIWLPGVLELLAVTAVAIAVFRLAHGPVEFLVLPPLVLIAVREGLRLTAVAALSFSLVATTLTGRGHGPIAAMSGGHARVLVLQAFIATTAFVGFLITATIEERRAAERKLEQLASHDSLTGLPNRRMFADVLAHAEARAMRGPMSAAVLYFDLDGFKEINDRLGHEAGDAVLVEVASRLSSEIRDGDLVARLGGDEFAAIVEPVSTLDAALTVGRRLARRVEQPFPLGGVVLRPSVSVGAALVGRGAAADLADADRMLYRRKAEAAGGTRRLAGNRTGRPHVGRAGVRGPGGW